MADKKEPEEPEKAEIPTEVIMDLDQNLRGPAKEIIYKAFSNEINLVKMCDFIKAKMTEKEEGNWNVVIGKDFASDIVHRSRKYGLYQVGELMILLWQSGGIEPEKKD